jgi:hypothetical protein
LVHGRRFGAKRTQGRSQLRRALLVLAWPITSFGFLARIWRNGIAAHGIRSLIGSVPFLLVFLACWSFGELLGYLGGSAPDRERTNHRGRADRLSPLGTGSSSDERQIEQ